MGELRARVMTSINDEYPCDACGNDWEGDEGCCVVALMPVDGSDNIPDFGICADCKGVEWVDESTLMYKGLEYYVTYC